MEETKTVWLVVVEYEPCYDGPSNSTYSIIAAYNSKEKAMSLAKELADNEANMHNVTSRKLRMSNGYEAYGNYYLVEELSIK